MDLLEALSRWTTDILPSREEFLKVIQQKKLVIYHGVDPTGPDLHLGHSTNLLLMRAFQDADHHVILLFGDFTARIGDPTDKTATRKALTEEEIQINLATYKEQASKILRFEGENPVEIRFNNDWLGKMPAADFLTLASHITHQQLIERDMFQKRIQEGKNIFMHELLYPLFQGYDSVAMKVDAEIGGRDQLFNMMVGRNLVKDYLKKEKFVITTPLLINPKTNKKLMNKSEGTYIAINDSPEEMFNKIMSMPDEVVKTCFIYCTTLLMAEIQSIKMPAMDTKKRLAWEIVKFYHDEKAANEAQENFSRVFQQKEAPDNITEIKVGQSEVDLINLLTENNLAKSRGEAKRLLTDGALELDSQVITNSTASIKSDAVLKIGKHRFVKLVVS
ncbi:tyrosine--tRNA ligase [Candidatus Microgenomates bacterium]|nr:tyrosine--tRNA ligase [Candidatus Microgenomates bacterium]